MKSFPLLAIPLGFMCVFYGVQGKNVLVKGERAEVLKRDATIRDGLQLIAIGVGYGFLVFRLFFE
jgi:hypothetical protein